jgi:asparagine synthase (glutamine-hydrolysing)
LQSRATRILRGLLAEGEAYLASVHGAFVLCWWDGRARCLRLVRDRFGIEPFFYAKRGNALEFASRVRDLPSVRQSGYKPSLSGIVEFLTFCFLPDTATLDDGVLRLPAGGVVEFHPADARVRVSRWYLLSYAQPLLTDEHEITTRYRALLEQSVQRQLSDRPVGAFLSGGMDSSSVVTFMRRHLTGPIRTFGFRCGGASFDESHYARGLAEALGTVHREVNFDEPAAQRISEAVRVMEVPFCDIGIEIGTWILAEAASGHVEYLLTGDGGDEFWASHPVYAAQRIVAHYDRAPIPFALRAGLHKLTAIARDSDHKRSLGVIFKRFLPAPELDPRLGPFRWRTYYTPTSIGQLLNPDLVAAARDADVFAGVLASYEGYDGPDDGISRHLYADYVTASSFYFSRLQLARHFGIEVRMPFYDHPLVEFGTRVPARLKLEGIERTKRLFRVAMEGTLPAIINHRTDKLGHSVPLKNWLRSGGALGSHVQARLRDKEAPIRQFVRPEALERMYVEHQNRRHNHSHRLWAAFVLDDWLRGRQALV